jgi:abequosyltransferase
MPATSATPAPKLSICIATFNRGKFIGETLDSVLAQMTSEVELVVVDGASPDDTQEQVSAYVARFPQLRYIREATNSGVDRDYDKAVGYARGEYCWLMTDDDLLMPGAVQRVLAQLDEAPELVLVNAEVRNVDFSRLLHPRIFDQEMDREYGPDDSERFLAETLQGLTFIGCVIVRRAAWMSRDREPYFGSLFIHVGVIFQAPWHGKIKLVAAPQMMIRYGNAMWTARGFEIWMFKWPNLVWSFAGFSDGSKERISPREPWRNFKKLALFRAIGGYSLAEYRRCWADQPPGLSKGIALLIAISPASLVNLIASLYLLLLNRADRSTAYDLSRSTHANSVSRLVARLLAV